MAKADSDLSAALP